MKPWHLFVATVLATALAWAADPEPADEPASPVQAPAGDEATDTDDATDETAVDTAAVEADEAEELTGERVDVGDVEGVFVPSEEISADSALSFPADI